METEKIAQYYDVTSIAYQKYWYRNSDSYSLHVGLWEKDTQNWHEAFINTNRFLAETGAITAKDRVLDAGCGVGGSSIWLAKTIGCKVVGITVSSVQQQEAIKLAKVNQVEGLTEFEIQDFTATHFPDESFEVVWGLESVCYAEDKLNFLKEAFRLLKPGGRLLVCDAFQTSQVQTPQEVLYWQQVADGFGGSVMSFQVDFEQHLVTAGFRSICFFDKTAQMKRSSQRMSSISRFTYPIVAFLKRFKHSSQTLNLFDKNAEAGIAQYELIKSGSANYGLFYAEK